MNRHTAASFTSFRLPLRAWLIVSAALVALALTVMWAWPDASDAPADDPPMRVTAGVAGPATVTPTLRLSGTLVAREDIAIGTALQDQRVAQVHVDVGERVRRGQLLARLETTNVQAQLQQAEAALSRAQAALREQQALDAEARATLARIEPLTRSGAVSAQQGDEQRARAASAAASLQAARADVQQAQAQVAEQRSQRARADILAPVDGVVSMRTARVGALAGAEPLFRLIGEGEIELDAEATATDLAQLAIGMAATVRLADGEDDLDGTVRLITPELDPRTRLGRVRVMLDATNARQERWRAGSHAEARFTLPAQTLPVAVPARAVTTNAERQSSVMLVDAQGRVSQRAVTPGRRHGDLLEIVAGLKPGERVVQEAIAFVRDGDVVTVANDREDGNTP
ncbi:efflux RND transporter periplasmic adaptor subunit [Acidovorax sp. SDU_ACID1]|uniref:efflux RND transporter periplasmic adaptor subunit n=1 Tax=Acidovorax sp. SDU_ACID1 TaxID=3136632 RepID=UPI003872C45C